MNLYGFCAPKKKLIQYSPGVQRPSIDVLREQEDGSLRPQPMKAWLARDSDGGGKSSSSPYALMRIPYRRSVKIPHGRGEIVECRLFRRFGSASSSSGLSEDSLGIYVETLEWVIVKKYRRWMVDALVAARPYGTERDPYRELEAMGVLGDDFNASSVYDALETERYLFLLFLEIDSCSIPPSMGTLEEQFDAAPDVARQDMVRLLLKVLQHLQNHKYLHRDISPDSVLLRRTHQNTWHFTLTDWGMAVPLSPSPFGSRAAVVPVVTPGSSPVRVSVPPQRRDDVMGHTAACAAPEEIEMDTQMQFLNSLDVAVDVWAMGAVILTILLGGRRLWERPVPTDIGYLIFIYSGGLTNDRVLHSFLRHLKDASSPSSSSSAAEAEQSDHAHAEAAPRIPPPPPPGAAVVATAATTTTTTARTTRPPSPKKNNNNDDDDDDDKMGNDGAKDDHFIVGSNGVVVAADLQENIRRVQKLEMPLRVFLSKMLQPDPSKRATLTELFRDDWMRETSLPTSSSSSPTTTWNRGRTSVHAP